MFKKNIFLLLIVLVFSSFVVINNLKTNDLVAVDSNVTKVTISKKSMSLSVGASERLTATTMPAGGAVNWASTNKKVATVDSNGNVKAVGVGSASIIVVSKDNLNVRDYCSIIVNNNSSTNNSVVNTNVNVSSIVLSKTDYTVKTGTSGTLNYTINPANATDKSVKWTSSNPNVVTVSSSGLINAVGEGTAVIRVVSVSNPSIGASCNITVKNDNSSNSNNSSDADDTDDDVQDATTVNSNSDNTTLTDEAKKTTGKTREFLESLDKMSRIVASDYKNGKYWKYKNKIRSTFDVARKEIKALNCSVYVYYGLQEIGVLSGKGYFYNKGNKTVYTKGSKSKVKKYLKGINTGNKKASSLIASGKMKAGDIVLWYRNPHVDVYAGNGKFYDAGKTASEFNHVNSSKYKKRFTTFGPGKASKLTNGKVRKILRLK